MTSTHRSKYSVSPKLEKYKEGYSKVNKKKIFFNRKRGHRNRNILYFGEQKKMPFDTSLGTKDNRIISLR